MSGITEIPVMTSPQSSPNRTKKSLSKMKKPALLAEAKSMRNRLDSQETSSFQVSNPDIHSLVADLAILKDRLNVVEENNEMLKRKLKEYKLINDESEERIRNLELSVDHFDQYGRRQNIEIAGIPNTIPQEDLEKKIIEILRDIGVNVNSYDIVTCHRLKGYGTRRNTSVRFLNQKTAIQCLRNKSKLRKEEFPLKNIYIFENLCQEK